MDTYQAEFIKQEQQDDVIIQNIEIKPEPQADSEVIIQTVDLKLEKVHQATNPAENKPDSKKKRVQKRWSKRTIMDSRYEDEPQTVKIFNITDVNALVNQPKLTKPRRIPKRFKADNFDYKSVGRFIDGSEAGSEVQVDSSNNIGYIKAEKELIIDDSLPENEMCSSGAVVVEIPQNSKLKADKTRKNKGKCKKPEEVGDSPECNPQKKLKRLKKLKDSKDALKQEPSATDHQEYHQVSLEESNEYPTELFFTEDYPSTSQDPENQTYTEEPEHPSTTIKLEDEFDDPEEATADPKYQDTPTDSETSDSDNSDNSKSNYKLIDGRFTCTCCKMSFKLIQNFDKHECIICQVCKKVFTTRCALKRHILHIHTETDEIFECKDCNKTFKAKKYLETHIKSHEKNHECENCGMKFGNTSRLNEHKIKHKNPEMLTCKLCDRKCASRSSLKFHMRVHDVDRPKNLKCDKCSFTTDDNRTLVKHKKSHAKQEEKFKMTTEWLKCEKCPARLKNKQSLNNHMYYVHSEMSFQCNLCGIVVKTERNLRRHWKNIHEHENKTS